jgi:hypothetical protein
MDDERIVIMATEPTLNEMMMLLKALPGNKPKVVLTTECLDPPHTRWFVEQQVYVVQERFLVDLDSFGDTPGEAIRNAYFNLRRAERIKINGVYFKREGLWFVEEKRDGSN